MWAGKIKPQRWGPLQFKPLFLLPTHPHYYIWILNSGGPSGGGSVCYEEPLHFSLQARIRGELITQHWDLRSNANVLKWRNMHSWSSSYTDVWMVCSIWIQVWTHILNPAWVAGIEVRKVGSVSLPSKAPELCHQSKFLMKEHRKLTEHSAFVSSLTISWIMHSTLFFTFHSDWNTMKYLIIQCIHWVKCSHPFHPIS